MKFNVGDEVRVLYRNETADTNWVQVGAVGTVTKVYPRGASYPIRVQFDDKGYKYDELRWDQVELATPAVYRSEVPPEPEDVGQPDTAEPRSWSLPAPPPDDVTVVHVPAAKADLTAARFHQDDDGNWWNDAGAEIWGWSKLLGLGTVVEGEPPAPEPQAAEPPRFRAQFDHVYAPNGDLICEAATSEDAERIADAMTAVTLAAAGAVRAEGER